MQEHQGDLEVILNNLRDKNLQEFKHWMQGQKIFAKHDAVALGVQYDDGLKQNVFHPP